VTESPEARQDLASRLRELRLGLRDDFQVTQRHVAEALGASVALVSSWESATAVPPEERVRAYARFFASPRSVDAGHGRMLPDEQLTPEEEKRRRELIDELIQLRERALQPVEPAARQTGALGGRFWFFPDGQPVVIAATRMSERQLRGLEEEGRAHPHPYARPSHPNFIRSLLNADMDATIEAFGHIRAENPGSEVRFLTTDQLQPDHLTGHLVVLGGGDTGMHSLGSPTALASPLAWVVRRMDLPVSSRLPDGGDEEYDAEFVVAVDAEGEPAYGAEVQEVYRPTFLRDEGDPARPRLLVDGLPQLEYDVALLARQPNPMNLSATITICTGLFSRGTYGAVRAFTDANLRARNEQYLYERFRDPEGRRGLRDFWMLIQVPVFQGDTITPDLNRPFHRLRASS